MNKVEVITIQDNRVNISRAEADKILRESFLAKQRDRGIDEDSLMYIMVTRDGASSKCSKEYLGFIQTTLSSSMV